MAMGGLSMRQIKMTIGSVVLEAELLETPTAEAIWNALPFTSMANEGDSIAVGFGRTPVSRGDEIRLAARTNIWGKAKGDVKQLKSVKSGAPIKVEKAG
jgi:hypothetical protein